MANRLNMKAKTAKKQIKRCQPIFDEWLTLLKLDVWEVTIDYYRKEKQFKRDNDVPIMRCWAKWEYCAFDVDVNLVAIRQLTDNELERAIVHELCHALVNELLENDPDHKHEERVVSSLTTAFLSVKESKHDRMACG